jgi:hypothetical protein
MSNSGLVFLVTPWNNLFVLRGLNWYRIVCPTSTLYFSGAIFSHLSDADTVPDHNIAILHGISRAMQVYFNTMQSSCKLGHIGRAGLLVIVLVLHNYGSILYSNKPESGSFHTCVYICPALHFATLQHNVKLILSYEFGTLKYYWCYPNWIFLVSLFNKSNQWAKCLVHTVNSQQLVRSWLLTMVVEKGGVSELWWSLHHI